MKRYSRVILIVLGSALLNFVLHGLLSPLTSSDVSTFTPSIFVKSNTLILAIAVWEVLAFGIFALIYLAIRDGLPGKPWVKGMSYGLSVGGLYVVGMLEMLLLAERTIYGELLMGLTDCLTFVVAGVLLGVYIDSVSNDRPKFRSSPVVIAIALSYTVGRYIAYSSLGISSAYLTRPMATFAWTLGLGLWVGVMYVILQPSFRGKSHLAQAVFFGVVLFGLNWLVNHAFIYTVAEFSFDLIIRATVDIFFTTLGVALGTRWVSRSNENQVQA